MSTLISRNELRRIASQLSDRDWSILRFIRRHHYANTTQIRRQFFRGHASIPAAARACARVLDRLYQRRIVGRLERRVGGIMHGSSSYVWCLDVIGDRLSRQPSDPRWRPYEPSVAFLDHTLAITETHVQLSEAESASAFELRDIAIEAEAWRDFVTPGGTRTVLKPDLKITVGIDDYLDHWYLEVDRGSESLPVLMRKCRSYDHYRRTGRAQAEHGVFPRVLWMLPDTRRVERLRAAIDAEQNLPAKMFVCTTRDLLIETLRDPP